MSLPSVGAVGRVLNALLHIRLDSPQQKRECCEESKNVGV